MLLSNIARECSFMYLGLVLLASRGSAYFVITEPTLQTQWTIGTPNTVSWQKGVHDDILMFDIEMARLGSDGLTLIAKNVPSRNSSLNILLQDVPVGNDYFLLFMNSTHGAMHATSPRFSVVSSSSSTTNAASVIYNGQTVTVSGAPNPTQQFAVTFSALASTGIQSWGDVHKACSFGGAIAGGVLGAVWTLW